MIGALSVSKQAGTVQGPLLAPAFNSAPQLGTIATAIDPPGEQVRGVAGD
jgi:hypothetical protein